MVANEHAYYQILKYMTKVIRSGDMILGENLSVSRIFMRGDVPHTSTTNRRMLSGVLHVGRNVATIY